jgi:hypothetical protein
MPAPYERCWPVCDVAFRHAWARAHPYCQVCGLGGRDATPDFPFGLQTHHLVKFGRSDEAVNLLKVCHVCHLRIELRPVRVRGMLLAVLPLGVCLTLKAVRDQPDWDPARLTTLFGRRLPELLPVPGDVEAEFRRRRPRDGDLFFYRLPETPM